MPSRPRQYEFARLNLDYTVMSKRKLLQLVQAHARRLQRGVLREQLAHVRDDRALR